MPNDWVSGSRVKKYRVACFDLLGALARLISSKVLFDVRRYGRAFWGGSGIISRPFMINNRIGSDDVAPERILLASTGCRGRCRASRKYECNALKPGFQWRR